MTGGDGRPPVYSSSSHMEQTELRPSQRRRCLAKKRVVKDTATSTDEGSQSTDSFLSLSSSGHDSETDVSGAPAVASAPKTRCRGQPLRFPCTGNPWMVRIECPGLI